MFKNFKPGLAAFCREDPIAGRSQQSSQRRKNARLIIDEQNRCGRVEGVVHNAVSILAVGDESTDSPLPKPFIVIDPLPGFSDYVASDNTP